MQCTHTRTHVHTHTCALSHCTGTQGGREGERGVATASCMSGMRDLSVHSCIISMSVNTDGEPLLQSAVAGAPQALRGTQRRLRQVSALTVRREKQTPNQTKTEKQKPLENFQALSQTSHLALFARQARRPALSAFSRWEQGPRWRWRSQQVATPESRSSTSWFKASPAVWQCVFVNTWLEYSTVLGEHKVKGGKKEED